MLSGLGFLLMTTFVVSILSGRCSAVIGLIALPIVFGLLGGFGLELCAMMMHGIEKVAPTGVLLMFAILYFAVMIETGLFDPLIRCILKFAHEDPLLIVMGTAILATVAAIDGDGTTTYVITTSAFVPLYRRLGMNPMVLATVAMLSFGVMNMLPWGGPMARAATALDINLQDIFVPLIPVMAVGLAWIMLVAFFMGKSERKRLKHQTGSARLGDPGVTSRHTTLACQPTDVWRFCFNLLLTIALLTALLTAVLPLPVLFMVAFAIAAAVNFPQIAAQKEFLQRHASNVMLVIVLVFASGIFTGILSGTKMADAMAHSLMQLIPSYLGQHLPVITAFASLVFTYFMANDPFYYGVLPIIAKTAASYGIEPVQIARASILGMPLHAMSPLMAANYLLLGVVGVDFYAQQRFMLRWALACSLLMIMAALSFAAMSL